MQKWVRFFFFTAPILVDNELLMSKSGFFGLSYSRYPELTGTINFKQNIFYFGRLWVDIEHQEWKSPSCHLWSEDSTIWWNQAQKWNLNTWFRFSPGKLHFLSCNFKIFTSLTFNLAINKEESKDHLSRENATMSSIFFHHRPNSGRQRALDVKIGVFWLVMITESRIEGNHQF